MLRECGLIVHILHAKRSKSDELRVNKQADASDVLVVFNKHVALVREESDHIDECV